MNINISENAKAFSVNCLINAKNKLIPLDNGENGEYCTNNNRVNFKTYFNFSNKIHYLRERVHVELCSRELWSKFHRIGTEMILTKSGRRMFPPVRVKISGLEENILYSIFLQLTPTDHRRYRFVHQTGRWEPSEKSSAPPSHAYPLPRAVCHPTAPAVGRQWTSQDAVSFDRLKLTNTQRPLLRDHVPLISMHRYVVKVHVMVSDPMQQSKDELKLENSVTFTFPETAFIAVTAYQNREITKLKCACNPFANGFRSSKGFSSTLTVDNPHTGLANRTQLKLLTQRSARKFGQRDIVTKGLKNKPTDQYKHRINSGVEDFLHKYPKVPIKFVIPPVYMNIMSNATNHIGNI